MNQQWGISSLEDGTYKGKAIYPIAFPKSVYETIPYDIAYIYKEKIGQSVNLTWITSESTNSYASVISNQISSAIGEWRFIAIGN